MFKISNAMKKHETLLYYVCTYDTKKDLIWTCLPQSIICSYARGMVLANMFMQFFYVIKLLVKLLHLVFLEIAWIKQTPGQNFNEAVVNELIL